VQTQPLSRDVDLRETSPSSPGSMTRTRQDLAAEIVATPHHYSKAAVEWAQAVIDAFSAA
jgi:hypothetical protein